MIIPVRCFSCGNVLADKYDYFLRKTREMTIASMDNNTDYDDSVTAKSTNNVVYLTKSTNKKTIQGIVMDDLGLVNPCCRRHMITHVDID
jgi:DNA-directed RNA polymerase I, II, and III subunit RPABC5